MKGYVKPELEEITGMMETVGLASGTIPGGGTVDLEWEDHDTGCFSTLRMKVKPGKGVVGVTFKLWFNNKSLIDRKIAHVDPEINDFPGSTAKITDGGQAIEVSLLFNVASASDVHADSVFSTAVRHITFAPGPYAEGTPRNQGEELGGDRVETGAVGWVANFLDYGNGVRVREGIFEAKKGDANSDGRIG